MKLQYHTDKIPAAEQVIDLYTSAGLPRPTADPERIRKMYEHSNAVISCWDGDLLVGVSRCITDWVWSTYLADLAVRQGYKNAGIGKKLVELTKAHVGEQSMVLLLSVPDAMTYYPKIGFTKLDNSFIINRTK